MRTPLTNRQCAYKEFYVFFRLGGKYSGCYTVLRAQSYEKAQHAAMAQYGFQNVGTVLRNAEEAASRVKVFGLTQI